MKKNLKTSPKNKFPKGWDEARVQEVLNHYENQTDEQAAAEDDRIFSDTRHTFMQIPKKLVPTVRKLLAKAAK